MKNKAVFFDRDDTLVINVPYNGDPEKVKLLPDAKKVCHKLVRAGFLLILISNQSGVGRGFITEQQVEQVNREVERQLGLRFDDIYSCFDDPENPAQGCRKPSPVMIQQAARKHSIDLTESVFVGDKTIDVQAGNDAGCHTAQLIHPHSPPPTLMADFVGTSLAQICKWILSGFISL